MEYGTGEEICMAIILRDMHIKSYPPECLIFCLNWCITRNSCVPDGLLFPVLYLEICTWAEVENGGKAKVRKVYHDLTANPLREVKKRISACSWSLSETGMFFSCKGKIRKCFHQAVLGHRLWFQPSPVFYSEASICSGTKMSVTFEEPTLCEKLCWHNTTAIRDESPMQLSFLLSYSLRSIDICQKKNASMGQKTQDSLS